MYDESLRMISMKIHNTLLSAPWGKHDVNRRMLILYIENRMLYVDWLAIFHCVFYAWLVDSWQMKFQFWIQAQWITISLGWTKVSCCLNQHISLYRVVVVCWLHHIVVLAGISPYSAAWFASKLTTVIRKGGVISLLIALECRRRHNFHSETRSRVCWIFIVWSRKKRWFSNIIRRRDGKPTQWKTEKCKFNLTISSHSVLLYPWLD